MVASAHLAGPLAFGGGPLIGDRLLRVLYLDETGHDKRSTFAAVGGLIIDHDRQWLKLSQDVEVLKDLVPAEFRDGFYFHATDLFHGGKYREKWPEEERWTLLEQLIATPRRHGIPAVLGYCKRPPDVEWSHQRSITLHAFAYSHCIMGADWFMINRVGSGEAAMVVAEERPEAHSAIRKAHRLFSNPEEMDRVFGHDMELRAKLPTIGRIKAPPAFASKSEEVLLQISDAVAFTFQRSLNGWRGYERLLEALFGADIPEEIGRMREKAADWICLDWAYVMGGKGFRMQP